MDIDNEEEDIDICSERSAGTVVSADEVKLPEITRDGFILIKKYSCRPLTLLWHDILRRAGDPAAIVRFGATGCFSIVLEIEPDDALDDRHNTEAAVIERLSLCGAIVSQRYVQAESRPLYIARRITNA